MHSGSKMGQPCMFGLVDNAIHCPTECLNYETRLNAWTVSGRSLITEAATASNARGGGYECPDDRYVNRRSRLGGVGSGRILFDTPGLACCMSLSGCKGDARLVEDAAWPEPHKRGGSADKILLGLCSFDPFAPELACGDEHGLKAGRAGRDASGDSGSAIQFLMLNWVSCAGDCESSTDAMAPVPSPCPCAACDCSGEDIVTIVLIICCAPSSFTRLNLRVRLLPAVARRVRNSSNELSLTSLPDTDKIRSPT